MKTELQTNLEQMKKLIQELTRNNTKIQEMSQELKNEITKYVLNKYKKND